MKKRYVESFAALGATLKNPNWSFAAVSADGAIVVSCWRQFFLQASDPRTPKGALRYVDRLSRIKENTKGADELKRFLEKAAAQPTPTLFKLVVAQAGDEVAVSAGQSGTSPGNRFAPRPDLTGQLVYFDGDEFVLDFTRS